MILIALAAFAAVAVGVAVERRRSDAPALARRVLRTMLYVLIPFVSYVNIAHLRVTSAGGVGLGFGWVVVSLAGLVAAQVGRRVLHLERGQLGAVVCCAVLANTGYLGTPIVGALLGTHALRYGVAYDQLVSGPVLFTLGFGVGAAYGDSGAVSVRSRVRTFLTRNPPLLGVIAGLLASPRLAPDPLPEISHLVVDLMLVSGFFAAGIILAAEREHDGVPLLERPSGPVLTVLGSRLLVAPLAMAVLSGLVLRVPTPYLIQAAMPSGLNALVVGEAFGLDQRLISSAVIWGTGLVLLVALGLGFA